MGKFIDLTGERFGKLTVIERAENSNLKQVKWKCICDCGKESTPHSISLRRGITTSCGCVRKENVRMLKTKHSFALRNNKRISEYTVWKNIKQRCENPMVPSYKDYGGRGIKVCDRWKEDFTEFLNDMGLRPSKNHSIERVNVDGDYEPDNCVWATPTEQSINRRISTRNKSGFKGVSQYKSNNKWYASISNNNELIRLGSYEKLEDAVQARKEAELKYWGKSS